MATKISTLVPETLLNLWLKTLGYNLFSLLSIYSSLKSLAKEPPCNSVGPVFSLESVKNARRR